MTVDETSALLLELGFQADGQTRAETVRVPSTKSPIHGRGASGGELRTFGGRPRFALVGTDLRATVGPRTVNLYKRRYGGIAVEFVLSTPTKYLTAEALRAAVEGARGVL